MKILFILILILPLAALGNDGWYHEPKGFASSYNSARALKLEKQKLELERQRLELEQQRVEMERERRSSGCYQIGNEIFCGGKQCTRIGDQILNC